jgi:hypothetical protein
MPFACHPEPARRREIDVAVGIIVGLRGCSEHDAFDQIADVVRRSEVPLSKTADALVALAAADCEQTTPAAAEATRLWSEMLPAVSRVVDNRPRERFGHAGR